MINDKRQLPNPLTSGYVREYYDQLFHGKLRSDGTAFPETPTSLLDLAEALERIVRDFGLKTARKDKMVPYVHEEEEFVYPFTEEYSSLCWNSGLANYGYDCDMRTYSSLSPAENILVFENGWKFKPAANIDVGNHFQNPYVAIMCGKYCVWMNLSHGQIAHFAAFLRKNEHLIEHYLSNRWPKEGDDDETEVSASAAAD